MNVLLIIIIILIYFAIGIFISAITYADYPVFVSVFWVFIMLAELIYEIVTGIKEIFSKG